LGYSSAFPVDDPLAILSPERGVTYCRYRQF